MKRKPLFKKDDIVQFNNDKGAITYAIIIQDKEILDDFGPNEIYYSAIMSLEDYMNKSKYHCYIKTSSLTLATDSDIIYKFNKIRIFS